MRVRAQTWHRSRREAGSVDGPGQQQAAKKKPTASALSTADQPDAPWKWRVATTGRSTRMQPLKQAANDGVLGDDGPHPASRRALRLPASQAGDQGHNCVGGRGRGVNACRIPPDRRNVAAFRASVQPGPIAATSTPPSAAPIRVATLIDTEQRVGRLQLSGLDQLRQDASRGGEVQAGRGPSYRGQRRQGGQRTGAGEDDRRHGGLRGAGQHLGAGHQPCPRPPVGQHPAEQEEHALGSDGAR